MVDKQDDGKQEGKGCSKVENIKKVAAEITNIMIFIAYFRTKLREAKHRDHLANKDKGSKTRDLHCKPLALFRV